MDPGFVQRISISCCCYQRFFVCFQIFFRRDLCAHLFILSFEFWLLIGLPYRPLRAGGFADPVIEIRPKIFAWGSRPVLHN